MGDRVYTVRPNGADTSRRALETDDVAVALAFHGTRPLLLFTRTDPADGTTRLWVTTTTSPGARRRAAQ